MFIIHTIYIACVQVSLFLLECACSGFTVFQVLLSFKGAFKSVFCYGLKASFWELRKVEKPHRGLLVHSQHVDRILSGEKTFEIRNMFCRCIKPNEEFFILRVPKKGEGKNANGQSVIEIAGTVIFRKNIFIPRKDFASYESFHRVSTEQYEQMRSGWKQDKNGCVAWVIDLGFVFRPPQYLPSGPQDSLQNS